jgi:hypothetical protein
MSVPFVGASRTSTGSNGLVGYWFGKSNITGTTSVNQSYDTYFIPSTLRTITVTDATQIGKNAFRNLTMVTSVILNIGLKTISEDAFSGMTNLYSIIIPISVSKIEEDAFSGSTNLTLYSYNTSKPTGWESGWNNSIKWVWGYKD